MLRDHLQRWGRMSITLENMIKEHFFVDLSIICYPVELVASLWE